VIALVWHARAGGVRPLPRRSVRPVLFDSSFICESRILCFWLSIGTLLLYSAVVLSLPLRRSKADP